MATNTGRRMSRDCDSGVQRRRTLRSAVVDLIERLQTAQKTTPILADYRNSAVGKWIVGCDGADRAGTGGAIRKFASIRWGGQTTVRP